ncbi:hypothetical protein [Mariniflexile sp.]|uniref:hypothetical protein n=1 Tax=Mariniflexile sp. TaxID=1979402 RepID=UPI0040483AAA
MKILLNPEEPPERNLTVTIILSLKESNTDAELDDLQTKFYNIFKEKFYDRCSKITNKLYYQNPECKNICDDVFQETFITAFEIIKDFNCDENWDDDECIKVVLFWLSKIANNKLLNQIKSEENIKENLKDYKYHIITDNTPGEISKREYKPTYDKVKYDAIWSKFTPMKKEIILLCAEYNTISEENTKHLPDDVISYLTKKYNIKPASIRKAKERALSALNACKIEK